MNASPQTPARQGTQRHALLALLLLVPVPSLSTAAASFWWPGTNFGQGLFIAGKVWLVVFPLLWWLKVEKGRWSWSPARQGGFGVAAILGLLIAAAIFGVYALTRQLGWMDPATVAARAAQTGLDQKAIYLAGAVYWVTLNSLMEEYVWRWFVFRQCEHLAGGLAAVFLSALAFTLHHVVALSGQFSWPMTLLGSAGVFTGGAIWSGLYLRYRSIWPGYVSHAIVDLPIFIIGWWMIFGKTGSG
jgi:membrane protease YdiL (CAAX protease family)